MKNFIKINRPLAAMTKKILFLIVALLSISNVYAVVKWDGTTEPWTKGAGTKSSPYLIENPKQLAYLADMVYAGVSHYQGVYFKQTEDFDMNGKAWIPSGTETNYFSGVYDGNNKMIHASEPKTGVIITDIDSKAYKYPQRYYTARRIIN